MVIYTQSYLNQYGNYVYYSHYMLDNHHYRMFTIYPDTDQFPLWAEYSWNHLYTTCKDHTNTSAYYIEQIKRLMKELSKKESR